LRDVPAVRTLRAVWVQQYDAPDTTGAVRGRAEADWPPSAVLIHAPHDPDARYSTTRDTHGVGYKAHLTETCDTDMPSLITDVQTTRGTTADVTMLPRVQGDRAGRDLLPAEHIVDSGYVDAAQVVTSRDTYGVDVMGPALGDQSWHARARPPASTWPSLPWTGTRSGPPARRGTPASSGNRRTTSAARPSSISPCPRRLSGLPAAGVLHPLRGCPPLAHGPPARPA